MTTRHDSILIVVDDSTTRRAISVALMEMGYHVSTTGDAEEAIEYVQSHRFDAAIIEWELPGTNGLALFKNIKVMRPELKTCILTGIKDESLCQQAIQCGVSQVLCRPVDLNKLFQFVTDVTSMQNVLLVDDDAQFAIRLNDALIDSGYRVYFAQNEESAAAQFALARFDMVLVNTQFGNGSDRRIMELASKSNKRVQVARLTDSWGEQKARQPTDESNSHPVFTTGHNEGQMVEELRQWFVSIEQNASISIL